MKRYFALLLCIALMLSMAVPAMGAQDKQEADDLRARAAYAMEAVLLPDMTDGEKALALHDWLALNCVYNPLDTATRDTAVGSLLKSMAVCRGYAAGYAYLTFMAGLSGVATYSEQMDHAWTILELDGSRYFSDATWDDTRPPCIGLVKHTWLAFSDETAENLQHYGWDRQDLTVAGGAYEQASWLEAVTRVVFAGEYLYYFDDSFNLIRCSRADRQTEILYNPKVSWPLWSVAGGRRSGTYTGLIYMDGRLWFNTPYEILSVDLDGEDLRVEYTADTEDGVMYGIDVRDGTLVCSIATEPKDDTYTLVDTGISGENAWGY